MMQQSSWGQPAAPHLDGVPLHRAVLPRALLRSLEGIHESLVQLGQALEVHLDGLSGLGAESGT